jgi:hypothetical protein
MFCWCERAQAGVDELSGAADVGGHQLVELGRGGVGVQVAAEAVGLDAPQAEQGPGRDLRLGVGGAHRGAGGQDLGGHGRGLVHHVGLPDVLDHLDDIMAGSAVDGPDAGDDRLDDAHPDGSGV